MRDVLIHVRKNITNIHNEKVDGNKEMGKNRRGSIMLTINIVILKEKRRRIDTLH